MSKDTKTVPTALKFAFGGLSGTVSIRFLSIPEMLGGSDFRTNLEPAGRMWCCLRCPANGSCKE